MIPKPNWAKEQGVSHENAFAVNRYKALAHRNIPDHRMVILLSEGLGLRHILFQLVKGRQGRIIPVFRGREI